MRFSLPEPLSTSPVAAAPPRSFAWPTLRQVGFQLHWFIGITAGTVLIVIGLSGAMLAFREEWLDALNPGVRHVAPRAEPMLSPGRIVQSLHASRPNDRVAQVTVGSEPGTAPRVNLVPPFGVRRGETLYLDPYSGAVQPVMRGAAFFEWVESLHRWLLLPREAGRAVTGSLAICLLAMALSGLYLRWPKRASNWRTWLVVDTRLTGRSFLWSLHSVLGTWALVIYLVSTSTGIYWAFDSVRATLDGWLAVDRQGRAATMASAPRAAGEKRGGSKGKPANMDDAPPPAVDIAAAWAAFQRRAGPWTTASLRLPQRDTQPLDIAWLAADAPHERARNRMLIQPGGDIAQDDRYAQGSLASRLQATVYPLHLGSYFGLPGRIAMTLAASMLPVFAVTGWMLYLKRRRTARDARSERSSTLRAQPRSSIATASTGDTGPWLIAYASQTGHAERLAWRTAASLAQGGVATQVESVATLDPSMLARHGRVLLVASSFGEGEPPDAARQFARRLEAIDPAARPLRELRFGLLALGDRRYADFCGFGHALDDALRARGAVPLFPMIEADASGGSIDSMADDTALARWTAALAEASGVSLTLESPTLPDPGDAAVWTLARRVLLNPGSQGGPIFELSLTCDGRADWRPGALVDIVPRHAPDVVRDWLQARGLAGTYIVRHGGTGIPLSELLARSELPVDEQASAQAFADTLVPLATRRYSVASIAADGVLELLVRQERHAEGLGVASGWLTEHAPIGAAIELQPVANPSFEPAAPELPCIFIGNGSGLAGLRSHLRQRVRDGRHANWLIFGERESAYDRPGGEEIEHWQAIGALERLDLVFSRDPPRRTYVQDRLRESADAVRSWVDRGACIFVCGSLLGMSAGVDVALRDILGTDRVDDLIAQGRYRRDVY